MNLRTLTKLGWRHFKNAAAEGVYLKTGCDCTRPVSVHALITKRCNSKCRYCEYWRQNEEEHREEMTVEEWQRVLGGLREFLGTYFIEFSGGEPFVKPGMMDICRFCRDNGIRFGITTNGLALEARAAEVVDAGPSNINVSIDAPSAEVHDELRGVPGGWERTIRGIHALINERDARGQPFPIIFKPTVSARNLDLAADIVDWAQEFGTIPVNFQPMDRWTPETTDGLWIGDDRMDALRGLIERLIVLKRAGRPVMNTEMSMNLWPAHFQDEKAPPEALPCRVGLRNFFILANGNIEVCWKFPPIGNARHQSVREIWYGPRAQEVRKNTTRCKQLCLFTCLSHKTLMDKVKVALKLWRR